MSSNSNRPKPSVGTGQQKVDTAVEPKMTKVADLVATNMDEVAAGTRKVDIFTHQETLEDLDKTKKELEFAKEQLNDIRLILTNPWHQVGYLVNRSPLEKIVAREFGNG